MLTFILAQSMTDDVALHLLIYIIVAYGFFVANLYLFRSIFNIPTFLQQQKRQITLMEQLVKMQSPPTPKAESVISEGQTWMETPVQE